MTEEPRRLSCAEAAEYLGVTVRQLERWRNEGRGPKYFRPPGSRPFYTLFDLDDWLAVSHVVTQRCECTRSTTCALHSKVPESPRKAVG